MDNNFLSLWQQNTHHVIIITTLLSVKLRSATEELFTPTNEVHPVLNVMRQLYCEIQFSPVNVLCGLFSIVRSHTQFNANQLEPHAVKLNGFLLIRIIAKEQGRRVLVLGIFFFFIPCY